MRLTVHFDYGSPYAYLAWQRITHVYPERYAGIDVDWVPVSAGHIFKQDGTAPNVTMPNQRRYLVEDVARWAKAYDVPFAPPPFGSPGAMPVNAIQALRIHFAAADQGREAAWMDAVYLAYFRDGKDISDPAVLAALMQDAGIEGDPSLAADPANKQRLVDSTGAAYAAGAPGVPFSLWDGATYWGNDRLAWVEAAIAGQPPPT